MKTIKQFIRAIGLLALILLALSGAGMGGALMRKHEQDWDNEVKTELVEGEEEREKT